MRKIFLFFLLSGCGVAAPPAAPSSLALKPALGTTVLTYRVRDDGGETLREVAMDGASFAEESGSDVIGSAGTVPWETHAGQTVPFEGDAARAERTASAWLGLEFAHPGPDDKMDVESCTRDRCTLVFLPKGGSAVWLDVDRATRRPTAIQWIGANDVVESCTIAFDREATAIASATCTHIVKDVGQQTQTWTLVEKHVESSLPEWARAPALLPPAG